MYYDLWRMLYARPHGQKRAFLDELLGWAGLESLMRSSHRLVSVDEAKQLPTSLIEVGAHTVTHPPLPELALSAQAEEIRQSKRILEELLGRSVTHFAYPHGHHEPDTVSLVLESGFSAACTTASGMVTKHSDCLALPRVQVLDWNGDEFRRRLEVWQSADGQT